MPTERFLPETIAAAQPAGARGRGQRTPRGQSVAVSAAALWLAGSATACFSITPITIGQKTSLESQLMGPFTPLSEEELLVASVRTRGTLGTLQTRALTSRRRQLFNRDDIDELKRQGCVGEGNEANLVARPCKAAGDAMIQKRRDRLVREESRDRETIITWVIANDPQLTAQDKKQLRQLYRQLLAGQARPGHWLQDDSGKWQQR